MDKESFGNVNGEEKGGENSSLEIAKKYTIFSVILDLCFGPVKRPVEANCKESFFNCD